jgi:predicted GNAT superfamily acetyltransferase
MKVTSMNKMDHNSVLQLNERSVELLSPLDANKLIQLIDVSALAIVAKTSDQVDGFMLAFTSGANYDSVNYRWFNRQYDSFLYIDRVVVGEESRGLGIGSSFYRYATEWAQSQALNCMVAEIDVLPPNTPSLLFHEKKGFIEVGRIGYGQTKTVSLQRLDIS